MNHSSSKRRTLQERPTNRGRMSFLFSPLSFRDQERMGPFLTLDADFLPYHWLSPPPASHSQPPPTASAPGPTAPGRPVSQPTPEYQKSDSHPPSPCASVFASYVSIRHHTSPYVTIRHSTDPRPCASVFPPSRQYLYFEGNEGLRFISIKGYNDYTLIKGHYYAYDNESFRGVV